MKRDLSGLSVSRLPEEAFGIKGSILILALWSICLLAAFAIIISYNARGKAMLIQRLDGRERLSLIAEAGVKRAITVLMREEDKGYDTLNDAWGSSEGMFRDVPLSEGHFSVCYNLFDSMSGASGIRYGLIDEERKLNINRMPLAVLKRLFKIALGYDDVNAQNLAASIIDWRDEDSELSVPLGSAEDSFYRGLKHPYEAKDSEVEVLDELLLVKGVTPGIFDNIKDYITVYGAGKVNINTASMEVLLALGINEGIAHKILLYRNGDDKAFGTPDDNIFKSASDIVPRLSQRFNLSSSEVAHLTAISELNLAAYSDNFMIKSRSSLDNGRSKNDTVCVVNRSGEILYWQESLCLRES